MIPVTTMMTRDATSDRRASVLAKAALFLGTLFLSLVAVEIGLRLKGPQGFEFLLSDGPSFYDTSIFVADREVAQVLRPGARGENRTPEFHTTVRINQLGLRGAELPAKAENSLRLLAVGDSFTLGLQVEENQHFAHLLGAQLSVTMGRRVEVLNAGVDSYGTQAATILASRLAEPTEADGILLTFFLGNDFWDNANFHHIRRREVLLDPNLSLAGDLLGRWSVLYSHFRIRQQLRRLASEPRAQGRRQEELSVFQNAQALERLIGPSVDALAEFEETCETLELPCFLAVAPPAFAVDTQRASATLELFGLDSSTLDLDAPARAVAEVTPQGIPVLDLAGALRTHREEKLYFTLDGHWTEAGHRVTAQALAPFLEGHWSP
jgi:lysophospholipase L1-like esterase